MTSLSLGTAALASPRCNLEKPSEMRAFIESRLRAARFRANAAREDFRNQADLHKAATLVSIGATTVAGMSAAVLVTATTGLAAGVPAMEYALGSGSLSVTLANLVALKHTFATTLLPPEGKLADEDVDYIGAIVSIKRGNSAAAIAAAYRELDKARNGVIDRAAALSAKEEKLKFDPGWSNVTYLNVQKQKASALRILNDEEVAFSEALLAKFEETCGELAAEDATHKRLRRVPGVQLHGIASTKEGRSLR